MGPRLRGDDVWWVHAMSSASSSKSKRPTRKKPVAFVYVLGSFHKGRYISYVGWTNDVTQRLCGGNKRARRRPPAPGGRAAEFPAEPAGPAV